MTPSSRPDYALVSNKTCAWVENWKLSGYISILPRDNDQIVQSGVFREPLHLGSPLKVKKLPHDEHF